MTRRRPTRATATLTATVTAAVVALLLVAVWWFALRDDTVAQTAVSVANSTNQLVAVTSGPMAATVSAEGTVAAAETDDLSFTSSGTVSAVAVRAGDTVTAGQVLAELDTAELQAAVTSAERDLADAEADLADDQGADASDEQLAADISSVSDATDALATAEDDLAGARLVATVDGTVASVDLTVGEVLADGTGGTELTGTATGSGRSSSTLGSSSDTDQAAGEQTATATSTGQIQVVSSGRFTVELSVDTTDIEGVEVGQTAGLDVDGTEATGTVTEVDEVADASSGVASYSVTVGFEADPTEVYVGSTVSAEIVTAERDDVLQVAAQAVSTSDEGSTVTVATEGTADGATETRTVVTGLTANGTTEITSGLAEGELLVVTGPGGGPDGAPTPPA